MKSRLKPLLRHFMIAFSWALLLITPGQVLAQEELKTLAPEEFISIIRKYHPVARQAGIDVDLALAQLQSSRGLFDPSLYFSTDQKTFDGKNYFNYNQSTLKIPTWFGVELMAGLENNGGLFNNNEVTKGQSSFAGFSIPLAKNLLLDNRRASLARAKLLVKQSRAEQELAVNDLIFEGISAYWQWVREYQVYRMLDGILDANRKRFELVKVTVQQGDRAGIDSTEALTQLLTIQAMQNEAYMKFLSAGFELSNYLWTENDQPFNLPAAVVPPPQTERLSPDAIPRQPLNDLLDVAGREHPKLRSFGYKIDQLQIDRQLKFQSLLPTLQLKYNALSSGYQVWNNWQVATLRNNYKFGLDFGLPFPMRQARGDYAAAKLKIKSAGLEQNYLKLNIENKVRHYYNEATNLLQQLRLQERARDAYQKIYELELLRFEVGESTLFMVNSRELKLLEARQKLAEVRAKYFKGLYALQWSAGVLR